MNRLAILTLSMLAFKISFTQELKPENKNTILTFINCVKEENRAKLSTIISYPLNRRNPLPSIKNQSEFLKRYDEIFDDSLKLMIFRSDLKKDWTVVGGKGIMFKAGEIWLNERGGLLAMNYLSSFERKKRQKLIDKEKATINTELSRFKRPMVILETKKFRIRIDELKNGKYRYASWSIGSSMYDKPDLVLKNGNWIPEGSGGNHRYEFVNGDYKYICSLNLLRAQKTPPADLVVLQKRRKILYQAAKIVGK